MYWFLPSLPFLVDGGLPPFLMGGAGATGIEAVEVDVSSVVSMFDVFVETGFDC